MGAVLVTTSVTPVDWLAAKLTSPEYAAVSVCVPAVSGLLAIDSTALEEAVLKSTSIMSELEYELPGTVTISASPSALKSALAIPPGVLLVAGTYAYTALFVRAPDFNADGLADIVTVPGNSYS